ncbi:hypothetical protein [Thalassiella azotivora]
MALGLALTVAPVVARPGGAQDAATSTTAWGATAVVGGRTAPLGFRYASQRLVDTRTEGPGGRVQPWTTREVDVNGLVPPGDGDVEGVALTVTVTGTSAPGHLVVWSGEEPAPATSTVNWLPGQTVTGSVLTAVSPTGTVSLRTAGDAPFVVLDVHGLLVPTSALGYRPWSGGLRVYDSRPAVGNGVTPQGPFTQPGEVRRLYVATRTPIAESPPPVVATATLVDVTAPATHLRVWTAGAPPAPTSVVTAVRGETRAVTVPVRPNAGWAVINRDGVDAYVASPRAHLLLDVEGTWAAGGGMVTLVPPTRVVDTRDGTGGRTAPLTHGRSATVDVHAAGVPADATTAVLTLTVPATSGPGFLQAWSGQDPRPVTSALNVTAGGTYANLALVPIGPDGTVSVLYQGPGANHLVVDLLGWTGPVHQP